MTWSFNFVFSQIIFLLKRFGPTWIFWFSSFKRHEDNKIIGDLLKKSRRIFLWQIKRTRLLNRGQVPIKAHCSLPDGLTKIHDELEIEVSHCDSQGCFTHDIDYDSVTIEQIIALIQSSTECYQKIEFHCLSTPLVASVSNFAIYVGLFCDNFLTKFVKLTVTINFSYKSCISRLLASKVLYIHQKTEWPKKI